MTVQGIRDIDELDDIVTQYFDFDTFAFDVETKGDQRLDTRRNDVFWISMSGPGRCDVIPLGHPIGERIEYAEDDTQRRINPSNGHHQERRINETSGREKWFDIPEPFTPAPKQLYIADAIKVLRPLFFSKRRKVGQNVKFDVESVAKYFGAIPPGPYGDVSVAARLINENEFAYRLGDQVKRAFKFEYDKKIGKEVEKHPYSVAYLYSYLDAKYTWLLWQLYQGKMEKEQIRHIFDIEMDVLTVVIDMEMTGIPIDVAVLEVLDTEFSHEMVRHKIAIDKAAGYEINLNANAQLAELVYETLGHTCKVFTAKTNAPSTAKEALDAFSRDPIVAKIQDHAQLAKLKSTFIDGIRRNLNDGRVHPSFNQINARTGRMSCSEPNVQQIPSRSDRGKRVREVFVAN